MCPAFAGQSLESRLAAQRSVGPTGQRATGAAKVSAKGSWASLRRELTGLPQRELVDIIKSLHDLARPNREFLQARLLGGGRSLETYRQRVIDAVAPNPLGRNPVRMAQALSAVREYTRATNEAEGTVDLLLSLLEAGTDQAVELGYGDERYFGSLLGTARQAIEMLPELSPNASADANARLLAIAQSATKTGYGFGDELAGLLIPSRARGSRA